jgi:intracellular multiplication protein IcmE
MAKSKMIKSIVGGDKSRNAYIAGGFFAFILFAIAIMWIVSVSSKPSEESKSQMARITSRQDISTGENKAYTKQIETFNSGKLRRRRKAVQAGYPYPRTTT